MKDMFSFSFLGLVIWCTSFLYKQSVASIIRRLYIILNTLLDINRFENPYQYMLWIFLKENENGFIKTISIKKNRNTFFLSTLWPNKKNQSCKVLFMFWSWRISWDFGKEGCRWGGIHYICALFPLYILLTGVLKGLYSLSNENWKCFIMEECICR